ncbi:MAG: DNA-3-methyladenine glycosylase 2 family protein, partial [Thermoleophilaceae bacterium]
MTIELEPRGAFSLDRSISFAEEFDAAGIGGEHGVFRVALVDDDGTAAAIAVRRAEVKPAASKSASEGDRLVVEHQSAMSDERIAAHAARILSVDIDGRGLEDVAARDPVVDTLVERFPGRRPVCFGTPYEAAAWSALSQRASMRQAAALKTRLTAELGERVKVADHELTAFPAPATVVRAAELPGVTGRRADRLRAVAQAALDGAFDPSALRALDTE